MLFNANFSKYFNFIVACTVELRCTIHKCSINVNVYDLYNCLGSESGLKEYLGLLVIWLCYYLTDTWSMAVVNLSFKHFHILYSLVQQLLDVNRHCSVYHNGVNCKYFPVFNSIRFYNYHSEINHQNVRFLCIQLTTIHFVHHLLQTQFKCILMISIYPDCLLLISYW